MKFNQKWIQEYCKEHLANCATIRTSLINDMVQLRNDMTMHNRTETMHAITTADNKKNVVDGQVIQLKALQFSVI